MARFCAATSTASSSARSPTFRTTPSSICRTIIAAIVGERVTVGHSAIIHACTIDDEVLIGMGAIILDGAEIGARSIIGANALVTVGKKIPPGSLVLGSPGRVVSQLADKEQAQIRNWALKYVENAKLYREHLAK